MIILDLQQFEYVDTTDPNLKIRLNRQELNKIPKHEDLLIIDLLEVEKLWPLNEFENKTIYDLHDSLSNHNGKIHYLSSDLNFFKRYKKWLSYKDLLYSNFKEEFIPYVFPYIVQTLVDKPILGQSSSIDELRKKTKIKNFINLTCSPKLLRLLLLDKYYQHQYFDYSFFPWHHGSKKDFENISVFRPFQWHEGQKIKSFFYGNYSMAFPMYEGETPTIILRDPIENGGFLTHSAPFRELTEFSVDWETDNSDKKNSFNYSMPKEVFLCNCDMVTESYLNYDSVFFTEKTFKEFIYKRPFLLFGAKNQNMIMKKLGFELYDEVFDYEFDTFDTIEHRFNAYCKQIDRYIDMKPQKFKKILSCLEEKIEYNFNHFLSEIKKSEKINSLASFNNENENMFVRDNTLNKLFENSKPLLTEYEKRLND